MNRVSPYLERARQLATPWYVLTIASIAGASVVAGVFDNGGSVWLGLGIASILLLVMGRDIRQRLANERSERLFGEYEGPVLWVVGTWILMRVGGSYAGDMSVVGVGLVAWLVVTHPRRIWSFPVGAALVLEAGMTLGGAQSPVALVIHLVAFVGASYALGRFADSEAFRSRLYELRMIREKALNDERRARDFGLLTEQAPMLESLPGTDGRHPTVGREMLSFIDQSLSLQLDQMRYSMGLTTAAVLWRTPQGLELKSHSSTRDDILCGPFPEGLGVPGSALRVQDEPISIAPVREKFGGLPYYERPGGIGSLMALAIRPSTGDGKDEAVGVLCIDRLSNDEWSSDDLEVMRRLARKISLDVGCGKRLKELETRKRSYEIFCAALKELNSAQTVEEANAATAEAVKKVVSDADFTAITFFDGQNHRVVYASGRDADQYSNIEFDTDGGLVGVALKKATEADSPRSKPPILPLRGEYRGKRPVFGHGVPLPNMRSMRIVPLLKPANDDSTQSSDGASGLRVQPVGALVVASTREGAFDESNDTFKVGLNFLQLIAGELATKLELAHLHDQLDEMATTDGLTGLNNHRTFQQAFDKMLKRANRQSEPMCLILADIDHFKSLNDTYGHPFGDEVLRGVSAILKGEVRGLDLAARYGGEEFALLLESSDAKGGRILGERVRKQVEQAVFEHPEKGPVRISVSVGVAAFPSDGLDKVVLIERADKALYHVKHSGRNRVACWSELVMHASTSAEEVEEIPVLH